MLFAHVSAPSQQIVLVRHGETEWSREGRHTGRTDLPLTRRGREEATTLGDSLTGRRFALVLTSPLLRAAETCSLAGLGGVALTRDDLREWDYGRYEGRTTEEIRVERPGWTLWGDGCPGGESSADVGARADRVVAELRSAEGDVAVFAHGHLLRVLGARWVGLDPSTGGRLALDTATVSILGYHREVAVLQLWNDPGGGRLPG
jgi:probable phosphoglycerate mutase